MKKRRELLRGSGGILRQKKNPDNYRDLLSLPGVGPYIAGAVMSIVRDVYDLTSSRTGNR